MSKQFFFRRPFKYSFFNVSLILVILNVLVYGFTHFYPMYLRSLALNVYTFVGLKMYWQPVTYMFVHGGFWHLFFNMFMLLQIGTAVERRIGSKEFLIFYFVTGILSGLLSLLVYYFTGQYMVYLLGASGAVYAILLAYAVIYPDARMAIWGIIPVSAPGLVILYAAIELLSGFDSFSNVAHFAHLFGLLTAWLYFVVRFGVNPFKVWKETFRKR